MNGLAGHRFSENELDWRYFSTDNYATSSAASASEADLEADAETEGFDFYDDETQPSESNEPFAPPPLLRQPKLSRARGFATHGHHTLQESRRSHMPVVATSPKVPTGHFTHHAASAKEADESTDTIKNLRARALDRVNRRGSTTLEEGAGALVRKPSTSLSSSPRGSKTTDESPRGLRRISDHYEKSSLARQSSSLRPAQPSVQPSSQGPRLMRYESHHSSAAQDQATLRQRGSSSSLSSARSSLQPQGLSLVSEDEAQAETTLTRANAGSLAMERSRRMMVDELQSLKARVEELEMERMSRSLTLGSNGTQHQQQSLSLSRPQAADLRAAGQDVDNRAYRDDPLRDNLDKHDRVSDMDDHLLRSSIVSSQVPRIGDQDMPAASLSRQMSLRKERMTRPISRQSSVAGSATAAAAAAAFASTLHVELLKDAYDFFEKTINHSAELVPSEHAVPSVQGMARIVSHALSMNQTIRTWVKADVSLVESSSMQALLRASDDQIRSLTESLLSTANLIAELDARSTSAHTAAPVTTTIREQYVVPSSPLPHSSSSPSASVMPRSPRNSVTTSNIYRIANLAAGHSTPSLGGYTSAGEDRAQPAGAIVTTTTTTTGRIRDVRQTWHPSGYESAGSISSFGQAATTTMGRGSNSAAHFRASLHEPPLRGAGGGGGGGGVGQGYTSDFSHDHNGSIVSSSGSSAMTRSDTLPSARRETRAVGPAYALHHRQLPAFRPQDEEADMAEQDPGMYSQQKQQQQQQQPTPRVLASSTTSRQQSQGAMSPRLSQVVREKRYSGIEQRLSRVQSPTGNACGNKGAFTEPDTPTTAEQLQSQQQQQQGSLDPVARRQASVRQLMAKYSTNSPTSIFFNTTGNGSMADGGQQEMIHGADLTIERNMREAPSAGVHATQERRLQQQQQPQQHQRHQQQEQETLRQNRVASDGRISEMHLAQPTLMERRAQHGQYQQQQHRGTSDMGRQRLGGGGRYASMAQSMVEMQHTEMQMSTPAISSASSSPSSSRVDGQSVGSHRVMTPDNGGGGTGSAGVTQQMLSPRGKGGQQHQTPAHHVYKMGHPKAEMPMLPHQQHQARMINKAMLY